MSHRNATCTACSDIGTLGKDPSGGGYVYCGCLRGLEAWINHLAFQLQEYAEALNTHDRRAELGLVTLDAETVENIRFAWQTTKYAHDQLSARRAKLIVGEIDLSEPLYSFFPDYEAAA